MIPSKRKMRTVSCEVSCYHFEIDDAKLTMLSNDKILGLILTINNKYEYYCKGNAAHI